MTILMSPPISYNLTLLTIFFLKKIRILVVKVLIMICTTSPSWQKITSRNSKLVKNRKFQYLRHSWFHNVQSYALNPSWRNTNSLQICKFWEPLVSTILMHFYAKILMITFRRQQIMQHIKFARILQLKSQSSFSFASIWNKGNLATCISKTLRNCFNTCAVILKRNPTSARFVTIVAPSVAI